MARHFPGHGAASKLPTCGTRSCRTHGTLHCQTWHCQRRQRHHMLPKTRDLAKFGGTNHIYLAEHTCRVLFPNMARDLAKGGGTRSSSCLTHRILLNIASTRSSCSTQRDLAKHGEHQIFLPDVDGTGSCRNMVHGVSERLP